jgi:hypothetical protein
MASLNNGHSTIAAYVDVPGRPNQLARIWRLRLSGDASDTVTVPELAANLDDTPAASNNDTVAAISDTAATIAAGATDGNNEVELTISGGTAGEELIIATLHPRTNRSTVAPDPV